MAARICLRDFLRDRPGVRPLCFYCGLRATTLDHLKPRGALGGDRGGNLAPACGRCNSRKGCASREAFRARLVKIAGRRSTTNRTIVIRFYGEGARGTRLRTLRNTLETYVRKGRLVSSKEAIEINRAKKAESRRTGEARIRWRGRFCFEGNRALRALARATGCTPPTIERFVLGMKVLPDAAAKLARAARALRLDITALRALKPPK